MVARARRIRSVFLSPPRRALRQLWPTSTPSCVFERAPLRTEVSPSVRPCPTTHQRCCEASLHTLQGWDGAGWRFWKSMFRTGGQSNSSIQAKSTSEKLREARPSNNLFRLYNGLDRPSKQSAFNLHCFSSLICAMTQTTMPHKEYGGKLKGKKRQS